MLPEIEWKIKYKNSPQGKRMVNFLSFNYFERHVHFTKRVCELKIHVIHEVINKERESRRYKEKSPLLINRLL